MMDNIPTWTERCEVHPDHQSGMVTNAMIQMRMQEEIDDLRAENARLREALENVLAWQDAVYVCAPELGGLLLAMYRARAALAEKEPTT